MYKLLSLLLFTTLLSAQDKISIGVYQDARLLVLGDDNGNEAATLDIKFDISLQGKQFKYYYFELRPQFEYANLSGGKYVSWLINGGWVFNKLIINNIEIGGYLTTGMIHRWEGSWFTYGLSGDISYKIGRFKISGLCQLIERNDLKQYYGTKGLQPNFYIGLKYEL